MQQEFKTLQQELQNNSQNPVFYRDEYGIPEAPLWNAPIPFDPTLQSTMDYYNNVFVKPNHRGQFPDGQSHAEPDFPSQFGFDRTAAGEAHLSFGLFR